MTDPNTHEQERKVDVSGEDDFPTFVSVRRKPRVGIQPSSAQPKMAGRTSWWIDHKDHNSKDNSTIPTTSQQVPKALPRVAYSGM